MRRIMITTTMICLSLAVVACSTKATENQPGREPQSDSSPAWVISLKSTCTAAGAVSCTAQHGFSVNADGKFQVGPAPKGQLITGQLTHEEHTDLSNKLQTAIAGGTIESTVEGHESGVDNESDDTLELQQSDRVTRENKTIRLARNEGSELYFKGTNAEALKALHMAIKDLARMHSPYVFGDDCGDAVQVLESEYATVQNCQVDSDCVYIDWERGYRVVAPQSQEWITVQACLATKTLLVANKLSILGAAERIQGLFNDASNVCGSAQFYRANCSLIQKATSIAPACVQNRCQSNL